MLYSISQLPGLYFGSLHLGQIKYMEEQISEFIGTYKNLDDTKHIKPKLHFAEHYGSQYRRFGNLINQSTLRFEGKHSNLKSIFSTSKNFKNPCLFIATRHQYLQSLHNMNNNFWVEDNVTFNKKYVSVDLNKLDDNLCKQVQDIGDPICDSIHIAKSVD